MGDWDAKLAALVERMPDQPVTSLSGTVSWMLPLFSRLAAAPAGSRAPAGRAAAVAGADHPWRGGFSAVCRRLRALARGAATSRCARCMRRARGFIGIADRGSGEGLRLLTDNGLFYEFIRPADLDMPRPARAWLADAEIGTEYALAITSNAGLWSVVIGDTVRLVSRDPPRLLITGRLSAMLSAFGEHLIAAELDQAMAEGAQAAGSGARRLHRHRPLSPRPTGYSAATSSSRSSRRCRMRRGRATLLAVVDGTLRRPERRLCRASPGARAAGTDCAAARGLCRVDAGAGEARGSEQGAPGAPRRGAACGAVSLPDDVTFHLSQSLIHVRLTGAR